MMNAEKNTTKDANGTKTAQRRRNATAAFTAALGGEPSLPKVKLDEGRRRPLEHFDIKSIISEKYRLYKAGIPASELSEFLADFEISLAAHANPVKLGYSLKGMLYKIKTTNGAGGRTSGSTEDSNTNW
jgi:hypothetical protein